MTEEYEFNGEKSIVRARAILETIEVNPGTTIRMEVEENSGNSTETDEETTIQGEKRELGQIQPDSRLHNILAYVDSTPGCTSSDVAEAFDYSRGSVSGAMTNIWKKRLVERTGSKPFEYEISKYGEAELERLE